MNLVSPKDEFNDSDDFISRPATKDN